MPGLSKKKRGDWASLTSANHGWKVATGQGSDTPAGTTFLVTKNWWPLFVEPASEGRLSAKQLGAFAWEDEDEEVRAIVVHHGSSFRVVTMGHHRVEDVNASGDRVTLLPE